jgi:hypothetical protein
MTEPYCAVCRHRVDPAEDHVSVEAETKDPGDMNQIEMYVFHTDCWHSTAGNWMEPA